MPDSVAARLAAVQSLWAEALQSPEIRAVGEAIRAAGLSTADVTSITAETARAKLPADKWQFLERACESAGVGSENWALPRYALFMTGGSSLAAVPGLPVAEEVKLRLFDQFAYVVHPDRQMDRLLNPMDYGFKVMCRFMRLERFPACQFDWEPAGIPRSYLLRVKRRSLASMISTIWLRGGGRFNWWESHTAFRRESPILTEEEERESFRLMGLSMRQQPDVRGYTGSSWLISPNLAEASPHLAWLGEWCRECVRFGSIWVDIGEPPPDMGFLVGDRRRRKLYETGAWKPRLGLLVWPREGLLRWHEHHYGR